MFVLTFSSLQQFPMVESRSGPQTIEFLTKRIVALGAVQTGHFLVDCETFLSIPNLGEFQIEHSFLLLWNFICDPFFYLLFTCHGIQAATALI